MSTRNLFDGQLVDALPLNNRATMYGDGVFRTLLVWNGVVAYEQSQIRKLLDDAATIGLTDVPKESLMEVLRAEAKLAYRGVIRLSLISGDGPRGYARSDAPCHWLLQHAPLPSTDEPYTKDGIVLSGLRWQLSTQPALAGVKHLNRLDQVMARCLLPKKAQEGLVQDQQGHWVSGIMSNLFWFQDGRWHTPGLQDCGVAGLTRSLLLQHLELTGMAAAQNLNCSSDNLHSADLIFVCNTLMGVWPVRLWVDEQQQQSVWSAQAIASFEPLRELQHSLKHPLCYV